MPEQLRNGAVIALMAAFLLAACGTDNPRTMSSPSATIEVSRTPVITPTASPPRAAQSVPARPTLPPTWTPTFTPTVTDTPTITNTPTPTATLSLEDICANSEVYLGLFDDVVYEPSDQFNLIANLQLRQTTAEIRFENLDTGEADSVALPGGSSYVSWVTMQLGPGPGTYRWSSVINSPEYGQICEQSGTFVLRPASPVDVLYDTLDTLLTEVAPTPLSQ